MLKIAAAFHHREALGSEPVAMRPRLQALGIQAPRRVNRYIELALYGALQCQRAAGEVTPDSALYLAAEATMLADCTRALHGIVVEQRPPTPFEFMNISGNMPGFYVAQQLGLRGPQLALHRHHAAFDSALELLQLASGAHRRALLGCVEEGVWPLSEQRRRVDATDTAPLYECSHWLYLDADCTQPLALVEVLPDCHSSQEVVERLREHAAGARLLDDESGDAPWHALGWDEHVHAEPRQHGRGDTAAIVAGYALSDDPRPLWCLRRHETGHALLRLFRPSTSTSA